MKKKTLLVSALLASTALALSSCNPVETPTTAPTTEVPTTAPTETPTTAPTTAPTEVPTTTVDPTPTTSETPTETEKPTDGEQIPDGYELVTYSLDVTADLATGAVSETIKKSIFQVTGGEIRTRGKSWTDPEGVEPNKSFGQSIKNGPIVVTAPGDGVLSMYLQNGSSGAATQFVKITDNTGTSQTIEFSGNDAVAPYPSGSPVVKIDIEMEAGKSYTIERGNGGTIDWYLLEAKCVVEVSDVSGFSIVNPGKTEYLIGEEFDSSKLYLQLDYANGNADELPLSDVQIISSQYDSQVAGTYEIVVKYGEYLQSYEVTVYEAQSIQLQLDYSYKHSSNSAAGNGQYMNGKVKTIYSSADAALDTTYLTAVVSAKAGDKTTEFNLANTALEYTGFVAGAQGKQTITATASGVSASYDIYVVDTAAYTNADGEYVVTVDQAYTGNIGEVSGEKGNMFTTISQALEFVQNTNRVEKAGVKILNVGAGYYFEKLEITTPNLTIVGAGYTTGTYSKDENYNAETYATATIIEFDTLYGVTDTNGFVHTTDSTQTVAVRDTAINCTIKNLTISNAWNCIEYFEDQFGYNPSEHRALALLVQSDQFKLVDSSLLGYQDTVEFFTGRQLVQNSFISGTTDFIFGTNNTTLFENCTIHSIYNGSTDGGYVTAFKGSNKGSSDYVNYGAIFYKCNLTADSDVTEGNTALGRPWTKYAAVAYIECTMGAHISTAASTGSSKNERYVQMSGALPTDEACHFVEFGNTGAGAVAEQVAGMTMLTAEEAAKYCDYSVIFGTSNGLVSYNLAWDPTSDEIVEDVNTYYNFHAKEELTGTNYLWSATAGANGDGKVTSGSTYALGDLTIDCTSGQAAWNQNSGMTNFKTGAVLKLNVTAGSSVTVVAYSNQYAKFTINGVSTISDSLTQYFAEDTEVQIVITGDAYIKQIVVNPEAEAVSAELDSLAVTGLVKEYNVGGSFDASRLAVNAVYTDNTSKTLAEGEYAINLEGVNFDEAGTYTATITYNGISFEFEITVVADAKPYIEGSLTVSFKDDTANAAADYLVYDNSAISGSLQIGKFTLVDNGQGVVKDNNDWLKFNTGGKVTFEVATPATLTISFYQDQNNVQVTVNGTVVEVNADGTYTLTAGKVVIEAVSNGYIGKVSVVAGYALDDSCTVSFKDDTANAAADYLVYDNSAISGSLQIGKFTLVDNGQGVVKDNNDWLKFNTGGKIVFNPTRASVLTITFYQDQNNVQVTANGVVVEVNADGTYTLPAGEIVIEAVSNGYIGKISAVLAGRPVSVSTGFNFKGGTYNSSNTNTENILNANNAAEFKIENTDEVTFNNVTFKGVVSNGDDNWLALKTNGTITFNVVENAELYMYYYNGQNVGTVTLNGEAVTTSSATTTDHATPYVYSLTSAGEVVITFTSNGYIGFFEVVYPAE